MDSDKPSAIVVTGASRRAKSKFGDRSQGTPKSIGHLRAWKTTVVCPDAGIEGVEGFNECHTHINLSYDLRARAVYSESAGVNIAEACDAATATSVAPWQQL